MYIKPKLIPSVYIHLFIQQIDTKYLWYKTGTWDATMPKTKEAYIQGGSDTKKIKRTNDYRLS